MKCAGSSVEHALYKATRHSPGFICAGSGDAANSTKAEYLAVNNSIVHFGKIYQKFSTQHVFPDYFQARILDSTIYDNCTGVTIVRNPWDMLVSYYWWMMQDKDWLIQIGGQGLVNDCVINNLDNAETVKQKFQKALTIAAAYNDDDLANHLGFATDIASPLIYFSLINSSFLDDRINRYLRYESLNNDYALLCDELGIDKFELPHHKKGFRKLDLHYSEYYNDWMKAEIEYYFGDYIQRFGYKFDNGV